MVMSFVFLLSCAVPAADAHGGLVIPRPWMDAYSKVMLNGGWQNRAGCAGTAEPGGPTGRKFREFDGNTLRCNAYWFTNWTRVPEGVKQDIVGAWSEYKTYHGDWTWKQRMPWSAPGQAPVNSPCGVDGGNPNGCWTGTGVPGSGNTEVQCGSGGYGQGEDARSFNFQGVPVTEWAAGSVQEVAWGILANHGGGYAYRLCKLGSGGRPALTENCFQNGHLNFAEEISHFKRFRTEVGSSAAKTFQGATGPWRRNPIPACTTWPGGKNCDTQFEKPSCAPEELYGFGAIAFHNATYFIIKDKVNIPAEITAGDYVLSWRYDGEQTPQVWFGCSSIRITSSYTGPQTFAMPGPTPVPTPGPVTNKYFTLEVKRVQTKDKYFIIDWNAALDQYHVDGEVHKLHLTTCRRGQKFWRGPVVIWKRPEVIGRRQQNPKNWAYQAGDILTDAADCDFVIEPESEPEGEQEGEGGPQVEQESEVETNPDAFVCAEFTKSCECTGDVYYGRKFVNGNSGVVTNLSELSMKDHVKTDVVGSIPCSNHVLGRDPAPGYIKHCICSPKVTLVQHLSTKLSRQVTMSVDDRGSVEQM